MQFTSRPSLVHYAQACTLIKYISTIKRRGGFSLRTGVLTIFFLRRIDIKNTIIINARATMALIPNGGARERTKGAKPPLIQQV